MKKILLFTFLISFGLFSMAQTKFQVKENLKATKSLLIKSSDQVLNSHSTHPYLKPVNHSNNGTDEINVIDIEQKSNNIEIKFPIHCWNKLKEKGIKKDKMLTQFLEISKHYEQDNYVILKLFYNELELFESLLKLIIM